MNNPAPTSNNNDSATCATINPLLKRETAPVVRRFCLSEVAKSSFVARHAGARPNSTPVSNETSSVNASTRQFTLSSTLPGINPVSLSVSATNALLPHKAKSTPATPPKPASSTLSVNNCRIKRQRPAPTASRTVISALREAARASNQQHERYHDEQRVNRRSVIPALVEHSATAGFRQQVRIIFRIKLGWLIRAAWRRHQFQRGGLKRAVQAGARLFIRRARFEPPHHIQPPKARFLRRSQAAVRASQQRLTGNRDGDGWAKIYLQRAGKRGWRHADDGERLLIEFKRLTDDRGVGGEAFLPELMAEHGHGYSPRLVIVVRNRTSQHGLYAQPGVIAARHNLPIDDLCLGARHDIQVRQRREGKEIAERTIWRGLRLAHPGKDFVKKQRLAFRARCRGDIRSATPPRRAEGTPMLPGKQRQRFRLFDRQGLEQHGIHNAEQRRIRADA